jgi:hypothetical protein
MADAEIVSEAARALAAQRWGDTRIRGLIGELQAKAGELTAENRRVLADLAAGRTEGAGDGSTAA